MAEGSVTTTGLTELRALAEQFPQRVDAVGLRVARGAANAMAVEAKRRLLAPDPPTKGPHVHKPGESMAEAVEVVEHPDDREVRVLSNAPSQYPRNLTIWREHGTIRQPARPYMAPAAAAVGPRYERDLRQALENLAREVFG